MPVWFQNQLQRAFFQKNRYQVQLLNQCWYFYLRSIHRNSQEGSSNITGTPQGTKN